MKGYDFLELDESQFITESNVEEISSYTTDIDIDISIHCIVTSVIIIWIAAGIIPTAKCS